MRHFFSSKNYINKINHNKYQEYNDEVNNYNSWKQNVIDSKIYNNLKELLILLNPHMIRDTKVTQPTETIHLVRGGGDQIVTVPTGKPKVIHVEGAWEYTFSLPDSYEYKKISVDQIKKIMDVLDLKDENYTGSGKNGNLLKDDRIKIINDFARSYGGGMFAMSKPINSKRHTSYEDL